MKKHYFITVRTYKSVNKMGEALANYVEKKYDHTVVAAECFDDIIKDVKEKQAQLEKDYPRSRPFLFTAYKTEDRYGLESDHVYVKPDSTYNDNVVYALDVEVIRNEVNVVSLSTEGGSV